MRKFATWLSGLGSYYAALCLKVVFSLGYYLGTSISFIIVSSVYISFITPYAFIYRLFHRSAVAEFFGNKKKESYYHPYPQESFEEAFFERPW